MRLNLGPKGSAVVTNQDAWVTSYGFVCLMSKHIKELSIIS